MIFHENETSRGDEIDRLNESWFFLVWTSDHSGSSTHSPRSRWPICILPASLYAYANNINITLEAVTFAVTTSFNKLATEGLKTRNLASLGNDVVASLTGSTKSVFSFGKCPQLMFVLAGEFAIAVRDLR